MNVNFIFCDPKQDLCEEWRNAIVDSFPDNEWSKFTVYNGYLSEVKTPFDCIVSPANSYARLEGSFDAVISRLFSDDVDSVISYCQKVLAKEYNGYQCPGTAMLIPMKTFEKNAFSCRYIAHCPTMRTPSNCTWNKEVVYNCMWNLLNCLHKHNEKNAYKDGIRTVFITGLGTGVGRFSVETCAKQMILAIKHYERNLKKQITDIQWEDIAKDSTEIESTYRKEIYFHSAS